MRFGLTRNATVALMTSALLVAGAGLAIAGTAGGSRAPMPAAVESDRPLESGTGQTTSVVAPGAASTAQTEKAIPIGRPESGSQMSGGSQSSGGTSGGGSASGASTSDRRPARGTPPSGGSGAGDSASSPSDDDDEEDSDDHEVVSPPIFDDHDDEEGEERDDGVPSSDSLLPEGNVGSGDSAGY